MAIRVSQIGDKNNLRNKQGDKNRTTCHNIGDNVTTFHLVNSGLILWKVTNKSDDGVASQTKQCRSVISCLNRL